MLSPIVDSECVGGGKEGGPGRCLQSEQALHVLDLPAAELLKLGVGIEDLGEAGPSRTRVDVLPAAQLGAQLRVSRGAEHAPVFVRVSRAGRRARRRSSSAARSDPLFTVLLVGRGLRATPVPQQSPLQLLGQLGRGHGGGGGGGELAGPVPLGSRSEQLEEKPLASNFVLRLWRIGGEGGAGRRQRLGRELRRLRGIRPGGRASQLVFSRGPPKWGLLTLSIYHLPLVRFTLSLLVYALFLEKRAENVVAESF